jgi:cold shock CspA family protein
MVEFGIVKFFDDRDGKKFGFLQPSDENGQKIRGSDVFFHFNDRGNPVVLDGQIVISSAPGMSFLYPQVGARIAFVRKPAPRGVKASPWTWADNWLDAASRLASGNPSNEDLPRRNWDDMAWCHTCNRDTGFCLCICYVCHEDLADCQCGCASCGVPLPGGGLCDTDFKSWNQVTQGPSPSEPCQIGKCTTCGQAFNKVHDVQEQYAGYRRTMRILVLHGRTTCLRCAAQPAPQPWGPPTTQPVG